MSPALYLDSYMFSSFQSQFSLTRPCSAASSCVDAVFLTVLFFVPQFGRGMPCFSSLCFRVERLISALGLNKGSLQFPLPAPLEQIDSFHFTERQICSYCSLTRVCIMKQSWPGCAGWCSKEVLPTSVTMAEGQSPPPDSRSSI